MRRPAGLWAQWGGGTDSLACDVYTRSTIVYTTHTSHREGRGRGRGNGQRGMLYAKRAEAALAG